jgi:hypothetical protein
MRDALGAAAALNWAETEKEESKRDRMSVAIVGGKMT